MKFNAPIIIVASVICLFIGCAAGKSGAQDEADATIARTVREFEQSYQDSVSYYRNAYNASVELLDALGIDDDSVDPYYDGDDAKESAVSHAYRRYCDAYNKLNAFLN